jgi:methylmalonyl-CoA mutase N-terminal domain/subunit
VVPSLESGFLQREIAEASYVYQKEEDRGERITVGVNEYRTDDTLEIPLLRVDREGEKLQVQKLNEVRRQRDNRDVAAKLQALEQAARGSENLMPALLDAVKAYATLGEMMDVFRVVFGEYQPSWGY